MNDFVGTRTVVTGGMGFIGSTLARALCDRGAEVTIIDSLIPEYGGNPFNLVGYESKMKINVSDVRDKYSLEYLLRDADIIFNLAGQTSHLDSMEQPETDLAINTSAQLSILETTRRVNPNAKVIFTSTRQIYGRPLFLPVDETHVIRPVDINGINKYAAEQYHMLYHSVYGLPVSVLRLTNTYGPRMRVKDARQTFLGVWLRNALVGMKINVFGDGLQLRDFNYVDDCVEALTLAAVKDSAIGKIYNLAGSEVISLRDLAEMLTALVPGSSYELVSFPEERKAIDIGDYYGSSSLIENELGLEYKTNLRSGLIESLNYFTRHLEEYL